MFHSPTGDLGDIDEENSKGMGQESKPGKVSCTSIKIIS